MRTVSRILTGLCLVMPAWALAQNVGLYDATDQSAPSYDVASRVVEGGGIPVNVDTPDAASLAGLDVLMVFVDNEGYGAEWSTNQSDIEAAVNAGMVLLTHDRDIGDDSPTSTLVPGAGSITFSNSSPDDDVRVHTPGTLIVNGPGGIIDDSTLDTGNSSYHGTVTASTLPADGIVHLSRQADSGDGVTVEWPYGSGLVIYSGIPLDCYQTGEDCDWDLAYTDDPYFKYVYTPNVVAYALNPTGRFQPESVPMLDKSGLILLAGLLVLLSVVRIRRIRARI